MKNKLSISILSALIIFMGINAQNAKAEEAKPLPEPNLIPAPDMPHKPMPPEFRHIGHGPQIDKEHPMHLNMPNKHFMEMEAKKAEFEKRLNLSEEQKQKRLEQKRAEHEKIKPIFDQIRAKKIEYRAIQNDSTLSESAKKQKSKTIKADLKQLKAKADEMRKQDMKNFESLLTPEQKKEFAKIKAEQKKEMEKRKKAFEEHRKERG